MKEKTVELLGEKIVQSDKKFSPAFVIHMFDEALDKYCQDNNKDKQEYGSFAMTFVARVAAEVVGLEDMLEVLKMELGKEEEDNGQRPC